MSKIVDTINKSIKGQVDKATKDASFNRVRTAQIIGKATSGIRTSSARYNIQLDGGKYNNVPVYGCSTFKKGDTCKVVIPNNQTSQMFILGIDTFPIGGVYLNMTNGDPTDIFYGTWESLGTITIGEKTAYAWQRIS